LGGARARAHHAERGERARRLVVAVPAAILRVEFRERLKRRARALLRRHRNRRAIARRAARRRNDLVIAERLLQRVPHRGAIGIGGPAVADFDHARETLAHHGHVRRDHGVAEAAEFFHVLLADALVEFLLADPVGLQERAHAEERAEEGIPLHAELQLGLVGRRARDFETRQNKDAHVVLGDPLPVARRDPLPCDLGRFARLPHEAAALLEAFERIGVRERLRVAAEHDVDMVQLAVHLDRRGRDGEIVIRGRAFFFRAVFRVGHHVEFLDEEAIGVVNRIALGNIAAEFTDELAEVFPRRDHAPAADRVEADRDRAFGEERGRVPADHRVGMIDAEDEIGFAITCGPSVRALGLADDELVGAERMLGPEIARADAVGAAEEARGLLRHERG